MKDLECPHPRACADKPQPGLQDVVLQFDVIGNALTCTPGPPENRSRRIRFYATKNADGSGLPSLLSSCFVCSAVKRPPRDALPGTTDDAPPQWAGPHPGSWNVALGDASVQTLPFQIDLDVPHRAPTEPFVVRLNWHS